MVYTYYPVSTTYYKNVSDANMLTRDLRIFRIGFTLIFIAICVIPVAIVSKISPNADNISPSLTLTPKNDIKTSQTIYPYNGSELSNITLELILHDEDHIVEGVMNIDYFNNDPLTFNALAFHTFVDGMKYDTRPGSINIYYVYENGNPGTPLTFETHPEDQYMWVNLSSPLAPKSRVQFEIHFNTTFPDYISQ